MEKPTEEELHVLREELREAKRHLPYLLADLRIKSDLAEKALKKYEKAKKTAEKLEYHLAQHDGRMKVIMNGKSGIKKKTSPSKPFDLKSYTDSLSKDAREAFIRELLCNKP